MERRLILRPAARSLAVGVLAAGTIAAASQPVAAASTSSVRLAPGVVLTRSSFSMHGTPEQVLTLSITLSATTSLVAASPGNGIGTPRSTTLAMARQEHAVAGINGDVFYLADPTAVPRGGLTHQGRRLKSALVGKQAALYVTAAGVATIGDPHFDGRVASLDGRRHYGIRSANSLENARNGAITLTDSRLRSATLPRCTMAALTPTATAGRFRVTSVRTGVTTYVRRTGADRALVTCGAKDGAWVRANLRAGALVTVRAGYAVPNVRTLISGGQVLVRNGRRYHDPEGVTTYGTQRKPESFACVLAGGRRVLLGVVEGERRGAAGMSYLELGRYLVGRHCWSAMTLDGSHSSTLVARRPHRGLAVVNHPTNPGGRQRAVVDGLFVVVR